VKKRTKIILLSLLTGTLLLSGCNKSVTGETDTAETPETTLTETESAETEASEPVLVPSEHTITVADATSVLAVNNLRTNESELYPTFAYHGGQPMRVVHTERGNYYIFLKEQGEETGVSRFYIAKTDADNNMSILYYGEHVDTHSTTLLNIGQDINGNVVATVGTSECIGVYIFDAATDERTEYLSVPEFTSGDIKSYRWQPGYSQAMFDFENRAIYMFYTGSISGTDLLIEWFRFDLETNTWDTVSRYVNFSDLGRHHYNYPVPDGNGGAYLIMQRSDHYTDPSPSRITSEETNGYFRDSIRMFYVPDLSSVENVTFVEVSPAYLDRADEGIISEAVSNEYGDVFVDAEGYIHITYRYCLIDTDRSTSALDPEMQYRHAIYKGMECVYNEKIEFQHDLKTGDYEYGAVHYMAQVRQANDGTLYLIAVVQTAGGWDSAMKYATPVEIEIYKANDALGTSWTHETTVVLENLSTVRITMSTPRNGSEADDILGCMIFTAVEETHGFTVYNFNLSLQDYTITEPTDMLAGFDLIIDERLGMRAPGKTHAVSVIHTQDAAYAALVYDYNVYNQEEFFYLVKIAKDGTASVLYSGNYFSVQDKYITMMQMPGGEIYVNPPVGNILYVLDPAADTVTEYVISATEDNVIQKDIYIHGETGEIHVLNTIDSTPSMFKSYLLKTDTMQTNKRPKLCVVDGKINGYLENQYVLNDGNTGIYLVATEGYELFRWNSGSVAWNNLSESGVTFNGYRDDINNALLLFYTDDYSSGKFTKVEIEAPYTEKAAEGITSVIDIDGTGDVYLDAEGKLHVFYTCWLEDYDDKDRPGNPELFGNTFKRYHAVYSGSTLVSKEELAIEELSENAAVRMAETNDGTDYLIVCNIGEEGAKIDVYFETEKGWALTQTKTLGEFTAESFSISSPRGGSVQDNVIDCIVYANDNDVYYTSVVFE